MTLLLVLAIGVLVGLGAWLLMDADRVRTVIGALLLGHGAVLVLMAPRLIGAPPLLGPGGSIPEGITDPVPQALALTAIVISFGVATLLLALTGRLARFDAEESRADRAGVGADRGSATSGTAAGDGDASGVPR